MEIVWSDAAFDFDAEGAVDRPTSDFGGLLPMRDVGYLIATTRTEIKLAVSVCESDNSYKHANTIPRNWVREIIHLTREAPPEPQAEASEASPAQPHSNADPR